MTIGSAHASLLRKCHQMVRVDNPTASAIWSPLVAATPCFQNRRAASPEISSRSRIRRRSLIPPTGRFSDATAFISPSPSPSPSPFASGMTSPSEPVRGGARPAVVLPAEGVVHRLLPVRDAEGVVDVAALGGQRRVGDRGSALSGAVLEGGGPKVTYTEREFSNLGQSDTCCHGRGTLRRPPTITPGSAEPCVRRSLLLQYYGCLLTSAASSGSLSYRRRCRSAISAPICGSSSSVMSYESNFSTRGIPTRSVCACAGCVRYSQ